MFPILIRTFITYFILIMSIKMTGKRQIGEMQLSELITAFLISEVAAAPLSDPDIPLVYGIIPILLLAILEVIIAFVTTKSVFFKKIFESPPTVIISSGKLNLHALQKQRMSVEELVSSLRLKDVADLSQIEYCFLEHNGQISTFTKDDKLKLPVICDGTVNTHYLKLIGRDEAWLKKRLKTDKKDVKSIFIMCTDGTDAYYAERKDI